MEYFNFVNSKDCPLLIISRMGLFTDHDLLVLGGGPGGYTAAFRAADLGLSSFG